MVNKPRPQHPEAASSDQPLYYVGYPGRRCGRRDSEVWRCKADKLSEILWSKTSQKKPSS
jgi:hypothetical protein